METSERQLFRARFAWLCKWLLQVTVNLVCLPFFLLFFFSCFLFIFFSFSRFLFFSFFSPRKHRPGWQPGTSRLLGFDFCRPTRVMTHPDTMMSHQSASSWLLACVVVVRHTLCRVVSVDCHVIALVTFHPAPLLDLVTAVGRSRSWVKPRTTCGSHHWLSRLISIRLPV